MGERAPGAGTSVGSGLCRAGRHVFGNMAANQGQNRLLQAGGCWLRITPARYRRRF